MKFIAIDSSKSSLLMSKQWNKLTLCIHFGQRVGLWLDNFSRQEMVLQDALAMKSQELRKIVDER